MAQEGNPAQQNALLANSPIPQFVIDASLRFLATTESFKDTFSYTPQHVAQILTTDSFTRLVELLGATARGRLQLHFKTNSGLTLFEANVREHEGNYHFLLFELDEAETLSPNHTPHPLHEALISLEELQERTDELRREADYRRHYLRNIIDTLPAYIDVRDEAGYILMANKPLAQFLGVDVRDLIGKKLRDFVKDPVQRQRMKHKHQQVFKSGQPRYTPIEEVRLKSRGEVFFFKEHKIPFYFRNQKAVLSVNTPIDELVRTERELSHSRQRYKRIFEHSPVGIFHFDNELKIKRCNQKFSEIMSIEMDAILGFDIRNKLNNKHIGQSIYTAMQTGESNYEGWFESPVTRKNIYVKCRFRSLLSDDNQPMGGVGIVEDLTSLVQSQQALASSESLLKTVFASLQDRILVLDRDCRLVLSNLPHTETESPDDKHCHLAQFGSETCTNTCRLTEVFETGENSQWSAHTPHDDRYLEVRLIPVKDPDGKVVRVVEHQQDITEHKRITRNLEAAKRKAEESDKLKSAFLQNISHEIRTPMNSIKSFTEFLQDDSTSPEDRHEFAGIIRNNSVWLLRVLDQIITLSKIESRQLDVRPVPIHFNQLMHELHRRYEQHILERGKNIHLRCHTPQPDTVAQGHTDYELLLKMLEELIDNAIKFTDAGLIEIGYELIQPDQIEFYVSDSGKGIAKAHWKLIFNSFRQIRESDYGLGGNGLGLSIARGIARGLGGNLHLDSELGRGTSFFARIPCHFAQPKTKRRT